MNKLSHDPRRPQSTVYKPKRSCPGSDEGERLKNELKKLNYYYYLRPLWSFVLKVLQNPHSSILSIPTKRFFLYYITYNTKILSILPMLLFTRTCFVLLLIQNQVCKIAHLLQRDITNG